MAGLPPVSLPLSIPMNPLEAVIAGINTNPYFIGLMMLLLNLGGRFLGLEMSKEQEKVFQHPWVRRALFFTVLFVATRNIMVALVMTIFVVLFVSILFNENSSYYLGKSILSSEEPVAVDVSAPTNGLTIEEQDILRRLTEKQARLQGNQVSLTTEQKSLPQSFEQIYMKNIQRMNSI